MLFKKKAVQNEPAPELPELEPEILETEADAPEEGMQEAPAENPDGENQNNAAVLEGRYMYEADLTASVSRNTLVIGNLTSKDNIEIFGRVEGDVSCDAVVKVHGEVCGNIRCVTLVATGAVITGNISGENSVVIGENSHITGDIFTNVASVSGRIEGNLKIGESVSISASGYVRGDIKTPSIEVSKGAEIYGSVMMEQAGAAPAAAEAPAVLSVEPEEPVTV